MTGVYDRLDQPVQALETFLQLAYSEPEEHYLASISLDSITAAGDPVKQDIVARLEAAQFELSGQPQAEVIQRLMGKLNGGAGTTTPTAGGTTAANTTATGRTPSPDETPPAPGGASRINLPRVLDLGDPITKMILTGHYDQAVAAADRAVSNEGKQLSMRLFQKGVAQLKLAEAGGDHDRYLDAGLSFMQVVIHFPESGYVGPSLVEAGVVHYKIGQAEIARASA